MTSVYNNPTLDRSRQHGTHGKSADTGYSGYVEPDTRVPPRPAAIIKDVSVNGTLINETDILAEAQNHPADTPGEAVRLAARALVIRQLLLQEANRLDSAGEPGLDAGGRSETADDTCIRQLVETHIQVPRASDAECRRYYENNPGKVSSPSISEARHILLAIRPEDAAARTRALEHACILQAQLADAPQEFGAVAEAHSDCPSARHGGNLGQLTTGSTVPEFERALATMVPGDTRPTIVETRFGVHVVRLERRIQGEPLAFEAVHDRIAAWLEAAAWSKAVSQYISILVGQADIRGIDLGGAEGVLVQ